MLHMVASRVNKRIAGECPRVSPSYRDVDRCGVIDFGPFVDELLPKFWEEHVKNQEVPTANRKNALTAWLWVRIFVRSSSTMDFLSDPNCSRL